MRKFSCWLRDSCSCLFWNYSAIFAELTSVFFFNFFFQVFHWTNYRLFFRKPSGYFFLNIFGIISNDFPKKKCQKSEELLIDSLNKGICETFQESFSNFSEICLAFSLKNRSMLFLLKVLQVILVAIPCKMLLAYSLRSLSKIYFILTEISFESSSTTPLESFSFRNSFVDSHIYYGGFLF